MRYRQAEQKCCRVLDVYKRQGEKGVDALSELEKRGVELISSQDAGLPRGDKHYGLYRLDGEEPVSYTHLRWWCRSSL